MIQLPILWALYRVIYNFPAYVPNVKAVFSTLVDKLVTADGASAFLQTFKNASQYAKQFSSSSFVAGSDYMKNLAELMIFAVVGLLIGLVIRIPFVKLNHFVEKRMEDTKMM